MPPKAKKSKKELEEEKSKNSLAIMFYRETRGRKEDPGGAREEETGRRREDSQDRGGEEACRRGKEAC